MGNLESKIISLKEADATPIVTFINNLNRQNQYLLLLGWLPLPFDNSAVTMILKFISSGVGKRYKLTVNIKVMWAGDSLVFKMNLCVSVIIANFCILFSFNL